MNDFKGKVVVITGGATGIGFSFAKHFGQEGAKIVIASRRLNRVNEAVEQLEALGIEAAGTSCDVVEMSDVEALADFAWNKFGHVDVIINNAGVGPSLQSVFDVNKEKIEQVININYFGVWHGVKVFGNRMIEQGTPCAIYNVGSENSFFAGVPMGSAYVASKHAVLAMTELLNEDAPDFMDVGLICPGLVNSEIGEDGINVGMDTDKYVSIAMEQIKAGKFYIVSHAYNMERINARYNEVSEAFATYAPRYEGDIEFDVRTLMAQLAAQQQG